MEFRRRANLLKELKSFDSIYLSNYGMRLYPLGSIKTVLDIGANVGFCSIAFRYFQPNARVLALEPDVDSFALLQKNVKNLEIETYQVALGDGREVGLTNGRNALGNSFLSSEESYSKVKSYLLSDIIKNYNINTDGLYVKIDCEGGEYSLFGHKESEEILKRTIGFFGEIHPRKIRRLIPSYTNKFLVKWIREIFSETHDINNNIYNKRYCLLTMKRSGAVDATINNADEVELSHKNTR